MSLFTFFKKKKAKKKAEVSVAELNESADYLSENQLLLGKLKPAFHRGTDGEVESSMEHLKACIENLDLASDSVEALKIEDEYLKDVQTVMKRAKAYQALQAKLMR